MSLFYAYANSYTDDQKNRYVIIFPSRNLADEWWRTLQDKVASGKLKFSSIQRVSPQFYLYDSREYLSISQTVTHSDGAPEFLGKIIFSPQRGKNHGKMDIIPIQNIVDHVSGNCFFLRSRYDPSLYWHHSTADGGFIKASRTERTRFRVSIRPRGSGSTRSQSLAPENYDGKIMIGSDNVQISLASDDSQFVCAFNAAEEHHDNMRRSSGEDVQSEADLKGKASAVSVTERFRESDQAAEKNIDAVSDVDFAKQGILRLGKIPESFRFREILDGLFDEWELA